jgi:2-polyprenyl-6-hydroxyphenyl methylase/3-demethylubiquinone-9 3-methyltransferase
MTASERIQAVADREAASDSEAIVSSVLRRIGKLKPPVLGASFLDVGCAAGSNTASFAAAGFEVTGVDLVPEFVALARESHPGIRFESSPAEVLPFPDDSFDNVVLLSVLEHVEDWRKSLAEAVRVLRPGGVLYVSTTNRLAPNQHEIRYLWGFGYLPDRIRRAIFAYAMRSRPSLIHHTRFPAYHWFTYRSLANELRKLQATPHHWLSLLRDEDVPARYRRPFLHSLVRFALRHPWTTALIVPTTTVLARKR